MGALKQIALVVLLISLITFVALFGRLPAFRKTPIGFLHRLILHHVPALIRRTDVRLTGGRSTASFSRLGRYLMNENHPIILVFFLTIVLGAELLFIPAAWSKLSFAHRTTTLILSFIPYVFIYKSVTSTSSVITSQNHRQQMGHYPYDHVLFNPGQVCRTCRFLKPARSKHCSVCNVCVAKQDHHCVWVMNCLGRGNYVFFLAMILSLTVLLSYGAYLSYILLDRVLQDSVPRRANGMTSRYHWSRGQSWKRCIQLLGWAFTTDFRIGGVGMLALLTAPLAAGLLLYHVYLIWAGMTTNESFKWTEWKDDIADGLVYVSEGGPQRIGEEERNPEVEPEVDWPKSCNQRLVSSTDGRPPSFESDTQIDDRGFESFRSKTHFRRVSRLHEVDNLYDLGFWNNLKDVLRMSQ